MTDTSNSTGKRYQQLIVIGNGFDLQCGLKSRYSDFIKPRRKYNLNRKTVWDIILEQCKGELWYNIEETIESWVTPGPRGEEDKSHFQRLLSLLNPNEESNIDGKVRIEFFRKRSNYVSRRGDDVEVPVAQFICKTHKTKKTYNWTRENLSGYLREQLTVLESAFKNYLGGQTERNKKYHQEAQKLIENLSTPEKQLGKDPTIETTVLSFNYTKLPEKIQNQSLNPINVHGKLRKRGKKHVGKIVFGIDGKDYLENPLVAPFTKTYRLLDLHPKNNLSLFRDTEDVDNTGASLDVIKFYGHSLSKSDYSYFQAIFDEVDLYSGNTTLIFYYHKQRGGRANMSKSVSRLLAAYGQTMNNKDHGKNLMHKLILEGRLSVRELKK